MMLIAGLAVASFVATAQNSFSYQSVIRNNGEVVSNQDVALLISILNGSEVCYQELQKVKTNAYGNISVNVGEGEPKTGSFAAIPWETMQIMMQIEVSTDGTENYVNLGQMQIQPVPYTMYAARTTTVIQPKEASEDPIFEVRDSEGNLMFAVYETGVKVYVDDNKNDNQSGKAAKSKFAVAGLTASKGERNLLTIGAEGTTVYVDDNYNDDDNQSAKAAKSKFAVAGRSAKGDNNFITIDGSGSTIYVNDNTNTDANTKAAKSKFAVAGRSAKDNNLLTVDNAGATVYVDDNYNENDNTKADTKAAKSRFAVAGRSAKGDKNIITIDGSGSTIYVDDNYNKNDNTKADAKAAKSKFAVAGRSAKKSENLFTIDGDGSTVYVDFNTDKAAKSRFAVAGRSAKGAEDALTIDGDQATFYIDVDDNKNDDYNQNDKAAKSRFAVAGRSAKDVQTSFVVDGSGTLIYIDEWDDSKAAKSTFAVAGRTAQKTNSNFFVITKDSTRIYVNDVPTVDTVSGEVTTPTLASAFAVVGKKQNTDLLVVNRDSTIVKMNTYVEEQVQTTSGVVEKLPDDTKADKVYAKGRIGLSFLDEEGDDYSVDISYTYYHRGNNEYLYLKNYFDGDYYEYRTYWLVDGYIYSDSTYIKGDYYDASLQTVYQWDSDYKEDYTPQKWDGKDLLVILESELRQAGYKVNFENGVNTYYQEEENETWDVMQSQQNVVTAIYDNDIFKSRLATFNSLIDSTYGVSSNGLSIAKNLNEMEWMGEEEGYILLDTCVNEANILAKENGEKGFYLGEDHDEDWNWFEVWEKANDEQELFEYTSEFRKRTLAEIDAMFDNFNNLAVSVVANKPEWGTAEVVNAKAGYKYGDSITLKATPTEGQFFISWSDGDTEQEHIVRVTDNLTYKAIFGSHTNIYVDTEATETDQTDGSEEKPFATIGHAIDKIKELNNNSFRYTIVVKGMPRETISIDDESYYDYENETYVENPFPAYSLTLQGVGDNSGICSNNYGSTPLQINAALPVILKNFHVNIDGYVNVNGNALALSIGGSANVTLEQGTQIYGTDDAWGQAKAGVYLSGKLTMNDSASIHNLSANNSGQNENGAGGIWIESNGELTMNGTSSIHSCHAKISGGAIRLQSGKVTMNENAKINNCSASFYSGGVYMEGGSFEMNGNSSISYCQGGSNGGGGVYVQNATFTMNGGEISHNAIKVGSGYNGGGVHMKEGSKFIMNAGSISNNKGGGVYIYGSSCSSFGEFDMRGGTISDNKDETGSSASYGVYPFAGVVYNCNGDYELRTGAGIFKMSGAAVVAQNNEVLLGYDDETSSGKKAVSQAQIIITGPLTHTGTVAKITPQNYGTIKPVLAVENNVSLADVYQKFELTQQSTTTWTIGEDGFIHPDGFVEVQGAYFNSPDTVENSKVFIGQRKIAIQNLLVSDHEVTQNEYVAVMGANPSQNISDETGNYPVENVSWFDALAYCNTRSSSEGLTQCYKVNGSKNPTDWIPTKNATVECDFEANGYRLPTEAEWEYIAREGSNFSTFKFSGSDKLDDVAWHDGNSSGTTHEVKTRPKANILGIYDMSGNVWEWCWDWFGIIDTLTGATGPMPTPDSVRVLRGGSFANDDHDAECSVYFSDDNQSHLDRYGFRVVRTAISSDICYVKYLANSVNAISSTQSVWKGYYLQPYTPTKEGYNFGGWYTDSNFENPFDCSQPITKTNIYLYAKWHLITLHVKGGSSPGNDETGIGTADKPLATLGKALEQVTESNLEYTIVIDGELTGLQEIGSSVMVQKLTLKGKNELQDGVPQDKLKGSNNGVVLTINNTTTPIVIEKLQITGGKSSQGGGIRNNGGTLTLDYGTLITGNSSNDTGANQGGAGLFTNGGTVTINSGAVISSNSANQRGGGLALINGASVTLNGGEIKSNTAYRYGGAIMFCNGTGRSVFTMESGTISGNKVTATSGTDGFGGCVYITQGEFILKGGDIINNTAGNSGGAIHNDDTFTMEGGTISGNTANGNAGAINNYNTITITGGAISGNTATGVGKAIYQSNTENGTFKMGGSAQISADNDVYLSANQKITITKAFDGNITCAATITPPSYTETTQVLNGDFVSSQYGKFEVKAELSNLTYTDWSILENGYIKKGYSYVDLGTGTLWATTNVGADNAWNSGDYFAWGETGPISEGNYYSHDYDWTPSGETIPTSCDAATQNWGNAWKMPGFMDFYNINEQCYWQWETNYKESGIAGFIVYKSYDTEQDHGTTHGSTHTYNITDDAHIFLPAAGYWDEGEGKANEVNTYGYYWSGTKYERNPTGPMSIYFDSEYGYSASPANFTSGYSVRPVRK